MKKWVIVVIILIAILFILGGIVLVKLTGSVITGEVIRNNSFYSYTKAACNETNYCQDYEIVCNGGEVASRNPVTGAAVQNSLDWEDPRSKEVIEKECE